MDAYRTSDLYYAAYLKVVGVMFRGTERDGHRVSFLFEDQGVDRMRDLRTAYFTDTAQVPPLLFVQAIKTMKTLTFSDKGD